MLSATCKYAIRALLFIAVYYDNSLVRIKDIAKDLSIPEPFLAKIMQELVKNKILNSKRGINGGFSFRKSPDEITFAEIIEIFDGKSLFHDCMLGIQICTLSPEMKMHCPFRKKLDPVRDKLFEVLSHNTIGDFAANLNAYKDFIKI